MCAKASIAFTDAEESPVGYLQYFNLLLPDARFWQAAAAADKFFDL